MYIIDLERKSTFKRVNIVYMFIFFNKTTAV